MAPSSVASSRPPTTPKTPTTLKLPKTALTYSPTDSDPSLRSEINSVLLSEGHIEKIQTTLTNALSAHPTNWPSVIRAHALSLLRSGECTTFPDLMARVLEDIKHDTTSPPNANSSNPSTENPNITSNSRIPDKMGGANKRLREEALDSSSQSSADVPNGHENGGVNGNKKFKGKEVEGRRYDGADAEMRVSLALPESVVEEGLKVTRECLKDVVTVED